MTTDTRWISDSQLGKSLHGFACVNCGHVIYLVDGQWFHVLSRFCHCDALRSKEARPE